MLENPLNDYVELTEDLKSLEYTNLLCGVIRGALFMVYKIKRYKLMQFVKLSKIL